MTFVITALLSATVANMSSVNSVSYLEERRKILQSENLKVVGANLILSDKELKVNEFLIQHKSKELEAGYEDSSNFLASQHFFHARSLIEQSPVFKFIKKIPKGASLHTHLTAAINVDFIIRNFTYREHLYGGFINDGFKLKFLLDPTEDQRCEWKKLSEFREEQTNFDEWLRQQMSLTVSEPEKVGTEAVWGKFKKIFSTLFDLFCLKSIFQEMVYQVLQELYDDNIMYAELKGAILPLYDLDGRTYSSEEFIEIFIQVVDDFKREHPRFSGVRYIHSIYRGVDGDTLKTGLEEILELKKIFPGFVTGIDLVGYEENQFLAVHHEELLKAEKFLKLFIHAGETNWYGHTDVNLVDAILLNASRIGHGFALLKHPDLLALARYRNIPLEICPISNQILRLHADPRNHPATAFIATGYPIVVGNDDPALWDATGLSYDWYITFMAMTPRTTGLNFLKQLALNSIHFSSMEEDEKKGFLQQWKVDWEIFLDEVLKENIEF